MGNADLFSADDQGVAPAVFGAENPDEHELDDRFDPASEEEEPSEAKIEAYVIPVEETAPSQTEITVQFARTADDELVIVAFSTPARLAACLGEDQPWIAIPKSELQSVQHACEVDLVEIDPVLPD